MCTAIKRSSIPFVMVFVAIMAVLALTLPARATVTPEAPAYPSIQYGTVHSYTTDQNANVSTTDGGYVWCYNGNCQPPAGGGSYPDYQTGQVHSYTTGLYAAVYTENGGYAWFYNG